ncbi:hypothetical protein [uncultured Parasutterella sp.]|uniref:hypothetical protein n=1 Tax=uncultured Parasutterella sp. TaxID=1263098 RepID=UPI00259273F0|nr:hypothetical protein [uncultured Parasutterella sp.]
MKLVQAAILSSIAAFAFTVNAAEITAPSVDAADTVTKTTTTTTSANSGGSITETVETIKGDASAIKQHVKDGNYTELPTDKQKLGQDVDNAKSQLKNSFSFGSGDSSVK